MPTLNWIGKDKVVSHHQDVPYRVLEHKYGFTADKGEQNEPTHSGNKIIHGDNLEALKSLLPEYEGKVKCIYIDPPYNTGKDEWKYNDKVEHPKIKKWLGEVVGKEGEDLTRHDKWLCMMYPRLVLLEKMLSKDGVIFISIDDNEVFNLKLILDEIFGPYNFLGNIIWQTTTDNNPRQITTEHEYIICYAKNKNNQSAWESHSIAAESIKEKYDELKEKYITDIISIQNELRKWIKSNKSELPKVTHYDNVDEKGVFHDADVANTKFGGYEYDVIHPVTGKVCKIPEKGYRFPESTMTELIANNDIMFGKDETTLIKPKKRLENVTDKLRSVIYEDGRASTKELESIFGKDFFKNPKSSQIIIQLLSFCTNDNDIILDSFAGSGTTGQAVLELNIKTKAKRKFLLIEMEDYADEITAKRMKSVMKGSKKVKRLENGLGGAFDFYELGLPLFDENQNLNEQVGLAKIREYIWFSETRTSFSEPNKEPYFLGKKDESAYYFIYEKDRLTTLDYDALELIKTKGEQYVIYADNCLLPKDFMAKKNIIFKKIPRDITRF
jgi:adenine-specific DNA-methyltransferase